MTTTEFNTKYDKLAIGFGLLRAYRATKLKWGIQAKPYLEESCTLFLILRTLSRAVFLTEVQIDNLFTHGLEIISGFNFVGENPAPSPARIVVKTANGCGCSSSNNTLTDLMAIIQGNVKPAPFSVFYADQRWNNGHTLFTDPNIKGLQFKVMNNTGNRFLTPEDDGFAIIPDGGFSITNPMYDGQEFILIF